MASKVSLAGNTGAFRNSQPAHEKRPGLQKKAGPDDAELIRVWELRSLLRLFTAQNDSNTTAT